VVVLEARDRVGGRVWTDRGFADHPVEFGAEFVHGDRADTWDLVRRLGLAARGSGPSEDESLVQLEDGGAHDARRPRGRPRRSTPPARWRCPTYAPGPSRTSTRYLRRVGWSTDQRRHVRRAFANAAGDDPHRLSAAAIRPRASDDDAGEGDFRLPGGQDALPQALADGLDVRLGVR
jgi:monoamine oxidase